MANLSDAFYKRLAERESSNNPRAVNTLGYMGLYQMGQLALQDAGYMNGSGDWTGKDGIRSQKDFLDNSRIQTKAVKLYHDCMWSYLADLKSYVGKTVGGIKVTKAGLIGAAHLVGQKGVKRFLNSGGIDDPRDKYDTACSEYLKLFSKY